MFQTIISIILFIAAAAGAVYATMLIVYTRQFRAQSTLTLGQVVGSVPAKRGKGTLPLIQFRRGKRTVSAPASVFDKTQTLTIGKKVSIRYLANEKDPAKWDIRIIGKEGYGRKKTTKLAAIIYAIAVFLILCGILLFFVF